VVHVHNYPTRGIIIGIVVSGACTNDPVDLLGRSGGGRGSIEKESERNQLMYQYYTRSQKKISNAADYLRGMPFMVSRKTER
jgi:hypothetical protein